MPVFKPFRGIRPHKDYTDCFPTHPLSNYTEEEIVQKAGQDFCYVKMVSPYLFGDYADLAENLNKIRKDYEGLLQEGKLEQDKLCYYLYSQTKPDGTIFRGFLGLVDVEEYNQGKIKKHESTLTKRKEKLAQYLSGVHLQAEPTLLTYPINTDLESLMDEEQQRIPILDYVDSRNIIHKIWKIEDSAKVKDIETKLGAVEAFYIADGHHRMGSTALNAERRKQQNPHHTGKEDYNFIYSFIVSEQSIKINDFNKLVKDLNGLNSEQFLEKLSENFIVEIQDKEAYYPDEKQQICMYLEGDFYKIKLKDEVCCGDCLGIIDHYIVEKYILKPILGIEDLKETKRVGYERGTSCKEGIQKLKKRVDSGEFKLAFGAFPVSFRDLVEIADKGLKMPPKCTYIEPKLVTALVMYDMK